MEEPSSFSRLVSSNLELDQAQPTKQAAQLQDYLALNSDGMSEMKNGPFIGLDLLKRPPWSECLGKAMLVHSLCFGRGLC